MRAYLLILIAFFSDPSWGHGNKSHGPKNEQVQVVLPVNITEEIRAEYEKDIKPIFESKCFNCHSSQTTYPWYHKVPVVGRIMDSHIKEGRSHIDFNSGYPFAGHGGPIKDLEEIQKVTEKDEMPPWYYNPFHKNSKLTDEEKKLIVNWSKKSLLKIKSKGDVKNESTRH